MIDDLYSAKLLKLAANMPHLGRLPAPDASSEKVSKLCGSRVVVDVTVREVQPYQFRYGASYDTEGRLGGVLDASVHNVLGKARVVGVGARYDAQIHEGRLYLTQPTLRHWPIQTTAALYYREEKNPATQISDAFNVDRRGASVQVDVERELAAQDVLAQVAGGVAFVER